MPHRRQLVAIGLVCAALIALADVSEAKRKKKRPGYHTDDEISRILMKRGLDPNRVVRPWGLAEGMREWAFETTAGASNHLERLRLLQERLLDPEQMAVEYQWGYTGTAAEVFEQRRANCLAFTNLFVGMAREIGVPVYFLAVHDVETFRKTEDLVVISDHIAVGYGPLSDRVIYDFSENPTNDYRTFQKISDLTAVAMFHSNRGAEALQAGLEEASVEWLETATKIEPEMASAWVNLGVARRRAGDDTGAENAYKAALEIDARIDSAYQNLAALFRMQGRVEEARGLEELLARVPTRNPYTYLSLGDISRSAGRLEEAEKFYRRAARLDDASAEACAALGQVQVALGEMRRARKLLKKARKLDPEAPRVAALAGILER